MATWAAHLAADLRAISGRAHQLDGAPLLLGGRHQHMNQPLGMHAAQRVRPAVPAVGSPSVAGCGQHG